MQMKIPKALKLHDENEAMKEVRTLVDGKTDDENKVEWEEEEGKPDTVVTVKLQEMGSGAV